MPKIILWLMKQEPLHCSQFTLDWLEKTVDRYQLIFDGEVSFMLSDSDVNAAVRYEVENILNIMQSHLLDADFFNQVLWEITKYDRI